MSDFEGYAFRFAPAYRVANRAFGVTPENSEVRLWPNGSRRVSDRGGS